MNNLSQIKKTSQAHYQHFIFDPGTHTCSLVEVEPPTSFKATRYHAIEEYFNRQIRKIKREGRKLDPEDLQSLINRYTKNLLIYPEDDLIDAHNRAMRNEPVKPSEQVKDTQGQREEPRGKSIDEAEERKNRAREEQYRVMQEKPVKTRTEPTLAPKRQEATKKKAKAKIIKFPKYLSTPEEIIKWCKDRYKRGEWRRILRALHKYCKYRKRCEDKYYPGKSKRQNRQYVYGQQWIAGKIGVNRDTIQVWFKQFEVDGIIYITYRGYKDRGASIIELAYTESHRRMNKRKTGERKKALSIR